MSGFEVAGVVLGAIPLLIEGLKAYGDGVKTIQNVLHHDIIVQDLLTSLDTGLAIYRSSCEQLLISLTLTDDEMHELLSNPYGDKWKDEGLCGVIRGRLGEMAFNSYIRAVAKLKKRVDLFKKKLYLDDDYKPLWVKTQDASMLDKLFYKPMRAMRIGFDSRKFQDLMKEIDSDILKIKMLTAGNIELGPLRLDRERRKNNQFWLNVRDHATRIFDILAYHWPAKCACQHHHRANLRLEVRENECDGAEGIRFGCLFSTDSNSNAARAVPWDWRDVEIEPLWSNGGSIPTTVSSSNSIAHKAASSPSMCAAKIDNLCKILEQPHTTLCCLGYLEEPKAWHHRLYTASPWQQTLPLRYAVTLKDALGAGNISSSTIYKYKLALTLASSVLQLHATPWLSQSWDLNDIRLISNSTSPGTINDAYVSRSFGSAGAAQAPPKSRCYVKNENIFALGVALIEISYGKPLLSLKTDADPDPSGGKEALTEYWIAHRLVEEVGSREGDTYAAAAMRCVLMRFDTISSSLEEASFRQLFWQGVVEPLRQLYESAVK